MTKAATPAGRKEYTLAKKHTHAGKEHQPGDKIQLTARQAAFIAHKLVGGNTETAEG